MELDELLNEVSESVNMNMALKSKQEALRELIADKVNNNFKNLFLPEVKKLWNFICKVSRETDIYTSLNHYGTSEWLSKIKTKAFMSFTIVYDDCFNCCQFVSESGYSWNIHNEEVKKPEFFNCWEGLVADFNTEEATLKTLEVAKKGFAEYFEKFSALLKGQNKNLSEQVMRLSNMLSNSSTTKQCKDGTIEIRIGGKTYVGTLKEES